MKRVMPHQGRNSPINQNSKVFCNYNFVSVRFYTPLGFTHTGGGIVEFRSVVRREAARDFPLFLSHFPLSLSLLLVCP